MLPAIDFESELAAVDAFAVAAELRLKSGALLTAVAETLRSLSTSFASDASCVSAEDGLAGIMLANNRSGNNGNSDDASGAESGARMSGGIGVRAVASMTNAARADFAHGARVARVAALSDLEASLFATAVRSGDKELYAAAMGARNDAHAVSRSLGAMLKGWGTAVTGTEPAYAACTFFFFFFHSVFAIVAFSFPFFHTLTHIFYYRSSHQHRRAAPDVAPFPR